MGLAIIVGMLSEVAETDPEAVAYYRQEFSRVNDVLVGRDLPEHVEPESLPVLHNRCSIDSYPYSFLHTVRRAYAHRFRDSNWTADPAFDSSHASDDPLIGEVAQPLTSHLLCHSDAEGFYLPIDFKYVIMDEERIRGTFLGSSLRLREELIFVAPALGITLNVDTLSDAEAERINQNADVEGPLHVEMIVWLSLFEATRLSIKHGCAICFS